MAPAAVGGGLFAAGLFTSAAAATAVVTAVYVGAAVGALIGAGTALVTGGDVLKGALKGAVIGGVSGGVTSALAGPAVAGTEVAGAGVAGTEGGIGGVGAPMAEAGVGTAATGAATSGTGPAVAAPAATTPAAGGSGGGGLLSGATNWINKNPMAAAMVSQGIGGVASGIAENRAADKELDALMKRDKLNYANQEISGLTAIELKTTLPSVGVFAEKPKWQMPNSGLIANWGGANAK